MMDQTNFNLILDKIVGIKLNASGGLVGYSHYPAYTTPPQYRRAPEGQQEFRRGKIHQQNKYPNAQKLKLKCLLRRDAPPAKLLGQR